MKKIIILAIVILSSMAATAQKIVFSDARPDIPVTITKLQSEVDTVTVLLETGFKKGVMVTPRYKVIYEKSGEHEGSELSGLPDFFIEDSGGTYTKQVKPIAFHSPQLLIGSFHIRNSDLIVEPNTMLFNTYPGDRTTGSDLVNDISKIRRQ